MRKRVEWVDIGKFICIMFVMLTHLESCTSVLRTFFSPFFLTGFFFLSGYVYKQPKSFGEHMIKKTKGLFVPWLFFSVVNILLSAIFSFKEGRNWLVELGWNFLQIRGLGDGIWFVAALFVAFIPFYFFIRWNKPIPTIIIAAILSVGSAIYSNFVPAALFPWGTNALPWHIESIFPSMLWMVLGYYFKQYGEKYFEIINKWYYKVIIWAIYLVLAYIPVKAVAITIPLSYIRTVFGLVSLILLCKSIKSNRYFGFIGANTLLYFALHGKVYAILQFALGKFSFYKLALQNVALSSITAIILTILLSIILILPCIIINRFFPWTLGKWYPKKGAESIDAENEEQSLIVEAAEGTIIDKEESSQAIEKKQSDIVDET